MDYSTVFFESIPLDFLLERLCTINFLQTEYYSKIHFVKYYIFCEGSVLFLREGKALNIQSVEILENKKIHKLEKGTKREICDFLKANSRCRILRKSPN